MPILLLIWMPIGLFVLWASGYRIHLLPDRTRYPTWLCSSEMQYEDISRLDIYCGASSAPMLDIWCHSSDRPLSISTKPFNKRDMAITVGAIVSRRPVIEMNDIAVADNIHSKIGDFPPLL